MPASTQGAAMQPKSARQQITQHTSNQQATSGRRHTGCNRAQTRASMTTEYQERFLPPCCYTAITSTSTLTNLYHPLKGTSADVTTFRSFYVTSKWIKNPPKAPQPSVPPKDYRRCSTSLHNPVHLMTNQMPAEVDYTTVYRNDFRPWSANKRWPIRMKDSLKVNLGLIVTDLKEEQKYVAANSASVSREQEPKATENITSYKSDYVPHPVQPRPCRVKPAFQTNKGLPLEPAASLRPKAACDINQEIVDEGTELFQRFKTWSLKTKFHSNANESSLPANHMSQVTEPILPSMQTTEKYDEPFQVMTTMKEECRVWDAPRCFTTHKEQLDRPVKTAFFEHKPKLAESCKRKTSSPHPKMNKTAVPNATSAVEKHQCTAENSVCSGFECTTGYEECRSCSLNRVAWPKGASCMESSQTQQIVSCMFPRSS